MPAWGEVRQWDPAAIGRVADGLKKSRDTLVGLQQDLETAAAPRGWVGSAADAAAERLRREIARLRRIVTAISAVFTGAADTEVAVEAHRRAMDEAEGLADWYEFTITDAGEVVSVGDPVPEGVLGMAVDHRAVVKLDLEHRIGQLMRDAEELDMAFADIMRKAAAGEFDVEGATLAEVAESAAAQADSPHDELLEKYQVATDPDGMTEWSPKWVGWLPGVPGMKVTAGEAEMLNDLQDRQGLKGIKAAYDIYQEALHRAENTFGGEGGTDGHADAFRHAYWNAMLTQRFGEKWTQEYATAHERNPDSHPTPVAMDLHNNEVGRRIALENPDAGEEELRGLVEQAVRDGEMVVISTDERLDHSDQVDLGNTRSTSTDDPWPTDNPERGEHRDPGEPDAYPERGY